MIRIVNLKNYVAREGEVLVKVDRSNKILGNQFYMHNESERDKVCDSYKQWFDGCIKYKNETVLKELRRIYVIVKSKDVALGCWCAPKRCHAETIKKFLEQYIK